MFKINNRLIGEAQPVYIVAEMSANHRQEFAEAVRLVEAAKEAGADAVKVQTYTADTLTIKSEQEYFRIERGLWAGKTLYDLYSEAYMPWEWLPELKKLAGDLGLDFFSTAFDPSAVDFLEQHGVPAHKVASFEITDLPLISYMAKTGKPLFISTGMASLSEIDQAVCAARAGGATEIALLKCTSAYPAPAEEMNLRTIPNMAAAFDVPAGLSDHTAGIAVPVAAVALGACIVEKHFTLSRSLGGPDAAFSLEPAEFREMAEAIRTTEKALGKVCYASGKQEAASRAFRRSLFVVRDMERGEAFTLENVRSIRPAAGLSPALLETVLGRRAACAVKRGTPLGWDLLF
ncbi:MAG: Pseudaminic acid synthase [Syntrophomonadaceae bacterium]|nr:Pseudaminic acid synthase [Bacillota bacterium]